MIDCWLSIPSEGTVTRFKCRETNRQREGIVLGERNGGRGRRADLFTKRAWGGVDDSGYYIVTVLPAGYGKC